MNTSKIPQVNSPQPVSDSILNTNFTPTSTMQKPAIAVKKPIVSRYTYRLFVPVVRKDRSADLKIEMKLKYLARK